MIKETEIYSGHVVNRPNWDYNMEFEKQTTLYSEDEGNPTPKKTSKTRIGVIIRRNGMVLIGKRMKEQIFAIPGGHLEYGETLVSCAKREVSEETGIEINVITTEGQEPLFTTYDIFDENNHYLVCYMLADYVSGGNFIDSNRVEPREPDKVDGNWFWVTFDELIAIVNSEKQHQWLPVKSLLFYRKEIGI